MACVHSEAGNWGRKAIKVNQFTWQTSDNATSFLMGMVSGQYTAIS